MHFMDCLYEILIYGKNILENRTAVHVLEHPASQPLENYLTQHVKNHRLWM